MALTDADRAAILAALHTHRARLGQLAETQDDDLRRDVWRLHEAGAALAIALVVAERMPWAMTVQLLVRLAFCAGRASKASTISAP
jgi:hypothetical protein